MFNSYIDCAFSEWSNDGRRFNGRPLGKRPVPVSNTPPTQVILWNQTDSLSEMKFSNLHGNDLMWSKARTTYIRRGDLL